MEYLFFLQNLREVVPEWVNETILFVSEFSAGFGGMMVMALIYWCVNKNVGTFLMMNFSLAYVCNGIVKNIFRIDRPFLKDDRLYPYLPATGYSFPSGHTMLATGFYGSLAVWQRKRTWLAIVFGFMAVFTGFTRNWLGAHTIQDVVVGILLSCGVIGLNYYLLHWVEKKSGRDTLLLFAAMGLCAGYCLALSDSVKPVGIYAGVMVGWWLERKFVQFEIPKSRVRCTVFFVVGIILVWVNYQALVPELLAPLGKNWAGTINYFVAYLLITAIWPGIFRLLCNLKDRR